MQLAEDRLSSQKSLGCLFLYWEYVPRRDHVACLDVLDVFGPSRYRILLEPSPESNSGDSQRSIADVQYERWMGSFVQLLGQTHPEPAISTR